MATKKIGLDAGHGLYTAGKQTPNGIKEWTLNDAVRDRVVAILSDYDCEIINTDNNEGAVDESLEDRWWAYINENVDAFVSIHHNASASTWQNVTGVEVYMDTKATSQDSLLAYMIYNRLVPYTGLRGRGVKLKDFYVINQNYVPAVLVEGGFMNGNNDYKVITSEAGQDAYARAVAEGLIEFLALEKKAPPAPVEPPKPSVDEVARQVIADLTEAGYDAATVLSKALELITPKAEEPAPAPVEPEPAPMPEPEPEKPAVTPEPEPTPAPADVYFPQYYGTTNSITSALKSLGIPSSFAYRELIAKANGINSYNGTAAQNTALLNLLKRGDLLKP